MRIYEIQTKPTSPAEQQAKSLTKQANDLKNRAKQIKAQQKVSDANNNLSKVTKIIPSC